MMDESCLLEIFKYQPMYDRKGLKTVFDRLAHSSIMRMNSASMDKVCRRNSLMFEAHSHLSMSTSLYVCTWM